MQNRGTCCLKKCFNTERSKGNFLRENLKKNSIANENALNSEGVLKYLTRHRKRYNPLALYHSSYWSHCWMDTHFLMYLLRVLKHLNIKKNCDIDINHGPLKHEPIKDMFILSIGMATSLISLCFSIIGIRSRSQLLLEENFFHCSGLLILILILT